MARVLKAALIRGPRRTRTAGFTLAEVLLAASVVAVLATLALPGLGEALQRLRRAEAVAALGALQLAQERWRANAPAYSADLAALGFSRAATASGTWLLAVEEASENGYTLLARRTEAAGGDARCATLALRAAGGELSLASACAGCELPARGWSPADPHRCWGGS